ncbi:MAG TPA: hypothetical protein VFO30_03455 [Chthoniobacterales bacterium]|nr:hypothetical protein [Chthoniobacterales bacterium]
MKGKRKIAQAGATGYILLWLLGIPIPIVADFHSAGVHVKLGSK